MSKQLKLNLIYKTVCEMLQDYITEGENKIIKLITEITKKYKNNEETAHNWYKN